MIYFESSKVDSNQSMTNELDSILNRSRSLQDAEITKILDHFQRNQSVLYDGIYGPWSDGAAETNQDMSNLFLDLCFDVIFVYHEMLGEVPKSAARETAKVLTRINQEMLAINRAIDMRASSRSKPAESFLQRFRSRVPVLSLFERLDQEIHRYALHGEGRSEAIGVVMNPLLVFTAALEEAYTAKRS